MHSRIDTLVCSPGESVSVAVAVAVAAVATVATVAAAVAASTVATVATVATIAVARLSNNHSEEGEGKKDLRKRGVFSKNCI